MNSIVWKAAEVRNLASHGIPVPELASPEQRSQGHTLRSSSVSGEGCWQMIPEHHTLLCPQMILSSPHPLPIPAPNEISKFLAPMQPVLFSRSGSLQTLPLQPLHPLHRSSGSRSEWFFSISATLLRAIRPMVTSCLQYFLCFEIYIVVKR